MSSKIILRHDDKEIEDHERALAQVGIDQEQFFALRAPWNPCNIARDDLVFLGLIDADYVRTELGEQRLAAYWAARQYTPLPEIVAIVSD